MRYEITRFVCVAGLILAVPILVFSQQRTTFYFPQIAAGTFSGGSWNTTIFVTNPGAAGTSLALVTVSFYGSDGQRLNLSLTDDQNFDFGSTSQLLFQIGAGETRTITSRANNALTVGYAIVTSNMPVSGEAIFSQYGKDGRLLGEAGVQAVNPVLLQAIIVDTRNGYNTGLAFLNPTADAIQVSFRLIDRNGREVTSTNQILGAGEHVATFVNQLFPSAQPMVGTLQVLCKAPIPVVALRFDPSFALFTTLPSTPIQ